MAQFYIEREVVVELLGVCKLCFSYIAYLVIGLSFKAYEEIVFIGVEIVLTILVDVVFVAQTK